MAILRQKTTQRKRKLLAPTGPQAVGILKSAVNYRVPSHHTELDPLKPKTVVRPAQGRNGLSSN